MIILFIVTIILHLDNNGQNEITKYQNRVREYLQNKYQKGFNIELSSKGYKGKEITIDHSTGRIGHYKNIKQYVFKVNDTVISEDFYVTVWKNTETGEYEVNEINGEVSNTKDTSYEKLQNINNKIKEIEKILKNNYIDYSVVGDINLSKIDIHISSSIRNEINKNYGTLTSIANINSNKAFSSLNFYFDDYTFTNFYPRSLSIIKEYFALAAKMTIDINQYIDDYTITYGPNTVYTINISKNIKNNDTLPEAYDLLYSKLKDNYLISIGSDGISTNTVVYIKFNDCNIKIDKYKTLDEIIREK